MTSAPAPTATACPQCRAPLDGAASCTGCGLPLTGPVAARLWEVDVALARLDQDRTALLAERGRLLWSLRGGDLPVAAPVPPTAVFAAPERQQEWTPQRVQNLLLGLGALLLAVAATVFGAVTYDRLGLGGRAAVLLTLTAVAAVAAPLLRARGLGATAEAVTAVALALAALDAWGLRRLGLGDGLADLTWLALTTAALSGLAAGYALATRLRLPRLASLALATAAGLLAVARLEPSASSASLMLSLLAAVHLLALAALVRGERTAVVRDLLAGAVWGGVVAGVAGAGCAVVAVGGDGRTAAVALAASALVALGGSLTGAGRRRTLLATLPVPLLGGAAQSWAAETGLAGDLQPVIAAAVAVAGLALAALVPRGQRSGLVVGAWAVAAAALLAIGEHVATALLGPLTWLGDPWSLAGPGGPAGQALSPVQPWDGSAAVVGVLLLTAVVAAAGGAALGRKGLGTAVAGGLLLVALLLGPLAADASLRVALLALVALVAGLVMAADLLRGRGGEWLLAAAAAPAVLAGAWSLADRDATLVTLPTLALLVALPALRPWSPLLRAVSTGAAALLAAAAVAAAGAARGMAPEQVGGLLLVVAIALVLLGRLAGDRHIGAQVAAALSALAAVVLASGDPGWLSWTLAGTGLLALLVALEPDRRPLAAGGGLLLASSSWVRLVEAGVEAPEPYVVPLALLALLLGHLRMRRDSAVGSHGAYGPGLALLLLPSLVAALSETGLARPLLLGAVALAVVLLGAWERLQAPLLLGGGTLVVLALDLLAPYASAVPRWTALAAAGTVLVVIGATFEQRRRDVVELRARYAGLR